MTNNRHTTRNIAAIALLSALAGAATAQDQATTNTDADLLRGPAVTDTHVPGAADSFAGRPMAGAAEARPDDRPISMREFIQSVRSLDRPGVAEELRLNDGQSAVVEVMLREHRDAMESWKAEHADELRDLKTDRQRGDKPRGRRGASDPNRTNEPEKAGRPLDRRIDRTERAQRLDHRTGRRAQLDEAAKAQRKALLQTRPSAEPQQAQIWDVLTPEQQAFVENDVQRRRADALAQREMRQQKKQESKANRNNDRQGKRQARGDRKGKHNAKRRGLPDDMTPEQFKQQMLERIETLPPEQQEKALERLNRALERFERKQQNPSRI